jgi:hypothetical protein
MRRPVGSYVLDPLASVKYIIANGPAARSFAADAHDCIMVRIKRSYRIQVCGTKMHPMASSPRILLDTAPTGARSSAKSPIAVHRRCACSGVKACPWLEPGGLVIASLPPFLGLVIVMPVLGHVYLAPLRPNRATLTRRRRSAHKKGRHSCIAELH